MTNEANALEFVGDVKPGYQTQESRVEYRRSGTVAKEKMEMKMKMKMMKKKKKKMMMMMMERFTDPFKFKNVNDQ
ncbi:unnamed protein product [Nippostrongylus brasiliensis]|uniref:Uncharacterized protein n=1 Tax=Nippostrongylus brasiliensis TaxID=27835 RepID=A0A0N4YBX7_NIPBR|nr:unnamed protein product [Nippostrongylus brasiliensis]